MTATRHGVARALGSLRVRLILLVLATVLPLVALRTCELDAERGRESARVAAKALDLARDAAASQTDLIVEAAGLLDVLIRIPAVRGLESDACGSLLAGIATDRDWLTTLAVAGPDGVIRCANTATRVGIDISDRPYFQKVLATGARQVSGYIVGRATATPQIAIAVPIPGPAGGAVAVATIDLRFVNRLAARVGESHHAVVLMVDQDGTVLARHPEPLAYVGQSFRDHPLIRRLLSAPDGADEMTSLDGRRRLVGFAAIAETGARIAIGWDKAQVLGDIESAYRRNLTILLLVAATMALVAWLMADLFIGRNVRSLIRIAKRLGDGDLAARAAVSPLSGEFRDLAFALNAMAGSLAQRDSALKRREAQFRTLASSAPVGIFQTNAAGICTYVNERWCVLSGLTAERTYGEGWAAAIHPDDREPVIAEWTRSAAEGRLFTMEFRLQRPGSGDVWVMAHAASLQGDAMIEEGHIGTIEDITEHKAMERLKSEFVSTVSHELRTPLTAIHASLGMVCSGAFGALPAEVKQLSDIALKSSERLVHLINALLDVEKIATGRLAMARCPVALADALDRALAQIRLDADAAGVTLRPADGWPAASVLGDFDRLVQVFTTLLSNAVKFSPAGGEITVTMLPMPEAWIRVSIHDQGPGIPADFQDRIFDVFAQADGSDTRHRGGTGLGLSIAKGIVEQHDGIIAFTCGEGTGTTFYVELPLLTDRA